MMRSSQRSPWCCPVAAVPAGLFVPAGLLLAALLVWPARGQGPQRPDAEEVLSVTRRTKELLVQLLASDDASLRSAALDALRQVAEQDVANEVSALLEDPDPAVQSEALRTREAIGGRGAEWVGVLRTACKDSSPRFGRAALGALARAGGVEAFEALLALEAELPTDRRVWWARALARRPEKPTAEIVASLLSDADAELRAAGAAILIRHGDLLPVGDRIALLSDEDAQVRAEVVKSLARSLGEQGAREALLQALADPSPYVRRAALGALAEGTPRLEPFTPLLGDRDATVRRAAVDVVRRIGGEQAVPLLLERLADPEMLVARAAGTALAALQSEAVTAALLEALGDEREQVVAEAARALGIMKHAASVEPILALLDHKSGLVHAAAYEALGEIGDTRAVPGILLGAPAEQRAARAVMNDALGRLGDARALDHLENDLEYGVLPVGLGNPYSAEDTEVATAAARALGRIGQRSAATSLIAVAGDSRRNAPYWEAAARSLGALGDREALEILQQIGVNGLIVVPPPAGREIDVQDAARIAGLQSIAKLGLRELVPQILAMPAPRCSPRVRATAAEVLTELTGRKYAYRPWLRVPRFTVSDLGDHQQDRDEPVFYPVAE